MAPAPKKDNTKLWLGIGGGCLLAVILACGGGYWYCSSKAAEVRDAVGGEFGAELTRISLALALGSMKASCMGDPSGAGTSNWFAPSVGPQYQGQACQITDATVEAFGRNCTQGLTPCSTAVGLAGTADESRAAAAGVDAGQCYVYASGSAKIIGCSLDTGYKIIHLENLGAVQ